MDMIAQEIVIVKKKRAIARVGFGVGYMAGHFLRSLDGGVWRKQSGPGLALARTV